jgi:hypothetical protein
MPRESDAITAADSGGRHRGAGPLGRLVALLATLAIFAAAGAWPVPDVNETVYLTKARHEADPAYGRGDFFLESREGHGVFFRLIGPLTAAVPLPRAAWIGRWLGWLALAAGFRHAIVPLVPGGWPALVAAALYSLALRQTTAAGEWVIGGCEAKVFAWALVLVAAGEVARGRFARAWLACGGATAVHVLVGGWGLVTLAAARAWSVRVAAWSRGAEPAGDRGITAVGLVLAGIALAAAGVVPAMSLSAGADAATRAAAARIYVVERLPHHLLPRSFAAGLGARHLLAIAVWWLLETVAAGGDDRRRESRARVARWTLCGLAVSLAGCAISLAEPLAPASVYGLLRYYWFRLGEGLLPLSLSAAAAATLADDAVCRRLVPGGGRGTAALRWAAAALLLLDLAHESRHWPLPGRGLPPRSDGKVDAASWLGACDWVRDNVPADACFLTPRGSASFTWHTGRREVVGWKNSPQDAAALVEWRRRIADCFSRDGGFATMERSTAALGSERMRQVADRYGADHAIVPADLPALAGAGFERLHANRGYVVYRIAPVPAIASPESPP